MSLGFIISLPCKITCSIYFLHQGETLFSPNGTVKVQEKKLEEKSFFKAQMGMKLKQFCTCFTYKIFTH